jgi:competence protein ComEC
MVGLLGASAVATVATAPITIAQFGYVPLAGLVMNLTAIPTASLLLVSSILSAGLSPVSLSFATNIGAATELLTEVLNLQAEIGGSTSGWTLIRPPPRLAWLVLPVVCLLALLPNLGLRSRFVLVAVAVGLPGIDLVGQAASKSFLPRMEVMFLDVGHGDAAVVVLPKGKTILIDAGNSRRGWDYGERVIIPHLRHVGITTIDAVIVSHPHADHFGGLPTILREVPIGCVYDNGKETSTRLYGEYQRLLAERIPCHQSLSTGDMIELDEYVSIDVLAPPPGYESGGQNDESVVLKLAFGATSFLFTGDVEHDGETILVENHCSSLRSDVVKVAHHGSRTSSTEGFVRCARASVAIISVGRPDEFGLPDEEIPVRWKKSGSKVISIRQSGYIGFVSDGNVIRRIQ